MMNDIKIKNIGKIDFEWAVANKFSINLNESKVGEIILWEFNKDSIVNNIEDDYAFYMYEDTHMYETVANFILDTIGDKNCIYIESLLIDKKYRGNKIGTKALEILKEKYNDTYIVLMASALDKKDKIACISNDRERVDGLLKKLDYFYKNLGFKNKDNIYYIN